MGLLRNGPCVSRAVSLWGKESRDTAGTEGHPREEERAPTPGADGCRVTPETKVTLGTKDAVLVWVGMESVFFLVANTVYGCRPGCGTPEQPQDARCGRCGPSKAGAGSGGSSGGPRPGAETFARVQEAKGGPAGREGPVLGRRGPVSRSHLSAEEAVAAGAGAAQGSPLIPLQPRSNPAPAALLSRFKPGGVPVLAWPGRSRHVPAAGAAAGPGPPELLLQGGAELGLGGPVGHGGTGMPV